MENANNGHIRDFKSSNGAVIQDFLNRNLEHTFFLRDGKEVKSFLDNLKIYQDELTDIKQKLKFENVFGNFKFGNHKPNLEDQKRIIDFQINCCDEIVVKQIQEDFENFKIVLEYAKNKTEKHVVAFIDIGLRDPMLVELMQYFSEFPPDAVTIKYRKIDSRGNLKKYRFVTKSLANLQIPFYASECGKRCGVRNFWELSISAILKGYFGFSRCCMNYIYPKKNNKFPVKELDKFNIISYSWGKQDKGDYYNKRLKDFVNLNKIKTSNSEITKRTKLKRLFDHLDKQS
ncbi:MAG: hypothetical protein ABIH59_02530 [archaeon]